MIVSKVEVVCLILCYLKEERYKESYEWFLKENSHLVGELQISTVLKKLKSLTSILNEYVQLKEEKKKRQSFSNTFGNDALAKSTLTKISSLLENYLSTCDSNRISGTPQSQQDERNLVPMSPKRQITATTTNATRRKPITPKKLKTSHTTTQQQNLSPLSIPYSNSVPLEQKSNTPFPIIQVDASPQPNMDDFTKLLEADEQLIKGMIASSNSQSSQVPGRIAELINQRISGNLDQSTSILNQNNDMNQSNLEQSEQNYEKQEATSPTHLSIGDINDLLNTIRTDPSVEAMLTENNNSLDSTPNNSQKQKTFNNQTLENENNNNTQNQRLPEDLDVDAFLSKLSYQ